MSQVELPQEGGSVASFWGCLFPKVAAKEPKEGTVGQNTLPSICLTVFAYEYFITTGDIFSFFPVEDSQAFNSEQSV